MKHLPFLFCQTIYLHLGFFQDRPIFTCIQIRNTSLVCSKLCKAPQPSMTEKVTESFLSSLFLLALGEESVLDCVCQQPQVTNSTCGAASFPSLLNTESFSVLQYELRQCKNGEKVSRGLTLKPFLHLQLAPLAIGFLPSLS